MKILTIIYTNIYYDLLDWIGITNICWTNLAESPNTFYLHENNEDKI